MSIVQILFYVMAFMVLASAIFVAASKNLVRSIFMFFITLLALAGLYVLALADFVAITQIVIYVGGILVLVLFAFMLSGRASLAALQQQQNKILNIKKLPALLVAILFFVLLVNVFYNLQAGSLAWVQKSISQHNDITPADIMTGNIGINLITRYLLPFEAISVLLLMALVGAAHLSRKEDKI